MERENVDAKRALLRQLAAYARHHRARIVCFFDGASPAGFATGLGSVTARFTHPRAADDAIVEETERLGKDAFTIVTSDLGLAARCRRRNVTIEDARAFARALAELPEGEERGAPGEDWESWFADPRNRNL